MISPDLPTSVAELDVRVAALEASRRDDDRRWVRLEDQLSKLQSSVDQMLGANRALESAKVTQRENNALWQWIVGLLVSSGVAVAALLIGMQQT